MPLYADHAALAEVDRVLRASGVARADEAADLLVKTLNARASAAARAAQNARAYSREIREHLRAATKGWRFHLEQRQDVAVAAVYRHIEAVGGFEAVGLKRMPDRTTVVRFVIEMAAELQRKDREATSVSDCVSRESEQLRR